MAGRVAMPPIVRFKEKFTVTPGCWVWTAAVDGKGYGSFWPGPPTKGGQKVRAHRFAYEHYVGPIPKGAHVLHRCDTPRCVNPDHLWLGSHRDNMLDKERKGRANHPSTITTAQRDAIVAAHRAGERVCDIVRRTGHKRGLVVSVLRRH